MLRDRHHGLGQDENKVCGVCVQNGETWMLPGCDSGGSYRAVVSKLRPFGDHPCATGPIHAPTKPSPISNFVLY